MNTSRDEAIRKTQDVLLEILKMFDKVCSDNDIEYFLAGGSCLGAIRHEGFLPWDDDIDLYMKASEWQDKKEILMEKLPEQYELICSETDESYTNPVIRICDSQTTQISRSRIADKSGKGVVIEIFLLDPLPEDEEGYKEYHDDFWMYCELMSERKMMSTDHVQIQDETEELYYKLKKDIARDERESVLGALEARLFKFSEEECSRYHLRWAAHWIEFPVAAFAKAVRVKFEDTYMPVPVGYPEVLYGEYGDDWMMIPDVDNVWSHDTIQNLEVPYSEYEKAYEGSIDVDSFAKAQAKNKEYKLDRFFAHRKMDAYKADHLEAVALSCLGRADFREVFLRIQEQLFRYHRLIGVNDSFLEGILKEKIIAGDLRFVDKVSKLYQGTDRRVLEIFEDLKKLRKVRGYYFTGEGAEHIKDALKLTKKYHSQINMVEFICQVQIEHNGADSDTMETVNKAIDVFGRRPRLLKILADGYRSSGSREEAEKLYKEILEFSKDGMVNLEIKKLFEEENFDGR